MSKRIKLFIVGSVLLNVLLLGVVIGNACLYWGKPGRYPSPFDNAELTTLPTEKRAMVEDVLTQLRQDGHAIRQEIFTLREQSLDLLEAEPFNKKAYEEHVAKIYDVLDKRHHRMATLISGVAEQLTPEERRIMASLLRRPPPPLRE